MALMQRRTWKGILIEALKCAGGVQYAGFEERMKYWLTDAYFRLCLTYHHYDLHRENVQAVKPGFWWTDLPTDCFIIMSAVEVEAETAGVGLPTLYRPTLILQNRNESVRQGAFKTVAGRPLSYARSGFRGRRLQFDCLLDAERAYLLSYYRIPDAPNFDSTSSHPEIERLWDEQIIDMALVRAGSRMWSEDLTAQGQMLLSDYLGQQVQPAQTDQANADLPDTSRTDQPRGGLQG